MKKSNTKKKYVSGANAVWTHTLRECVCMCGYAYVCMRGTIEWMKAIIEC